MEANIIIHENSLYISINKKNEGILHISGTSFNISPLDIPHIAEGIARSINDNESYSFIRHSYAIFLKIYYGTNRDGNSMVYFTNGKDTEYISFKDAKKIFDFCIGYINSIPTSYFIDIVSVQLKYVNLR